MGGHPPTTPDLRFLLRYRRWTLWTSRLTLWTNKIGLQGGLGVKRSCALWMSGDLMVLQLDPLAQVTTLWTSVT
jgi:hypothetical protein